MQYYDEYKTDGGAFAFKIGIIYRPLKWLRAAYSFQTPVTYYLNDSYSHSMEARGVEVEGDYLNPYAASTLGYYDYKIQTPLRMMGALGFVIGKKATIGLEYEYLDYTTANIHSNTSNNEFAETNAQIEEVLKASHNAKIGFEYRLGLFSLRTGVSYFDSPYKSSQLNKDAYTIYYNGGLGFNVNFFYVNFAYSRGITNYYYFPYSIEGVETVPYKINRATNKYIVTFGVRF